MGPLRIVFEQTAEEAVRRIVMDGVDLHNVAATGHSAFYPMCFLLRSVRDEIVGGVLGYLWGGWLQVQYLWVAEPLRGQGHASRLMDSAEGYAVERGCTAAALETHSFQALAFYQKRGYAVFGTLEDYPPGHAKHFLRKALAVGGD